jgi:ferric-dicitrate binding protein FerR (iron transport regulator)
LFQGDAQMAKDNQNLQLHANQQGLFSEPLTLKSNANLNEVIGWKYGQFVFRDADMERIKRQIDRWYNVRITGASAITARFNITAERNQPLSKLLHQLEATGQVHFTIKGRKIFVFNL